MASIPLEVRNVEEDSRYGYCRCGCGQRTSIPKYGDVSKGWIAGIPLPCCNGHFHRKQKRYEIDLVTGCWNWLLVTATNGYARCKIGGRYQAVHQVMYEIFRGEIPVGLDLDHLCRNRRCINPEHLEPVTRTINARRGAMSKLNEDKARQIRLLNANGYTHRRLAAMFGVEKSAVTAVLSGRTWKDLG